MPAEWRIAEENAARQLRSRVLQDVISSMDRAEMTALLRLVNRGEERRSLCVGEQWSTAPGEP
jgi:hypothetical protein